MEKLSTAPFASPLEKELLVVRDRVMKGSGFSTLEPEIWNNFVVYADADE